jgi:hypothetical protein
MADDRALPGADSRHVRGGREMAVVVDMWQNLTRICGAQCGDPIREGQLLEWHAGALWHADCLAMRRSA